MNIKDLASLAIKLLGLYMLINFISTIPSYFSIGSIPIDEPSMRMSFIIGISISAVLYFMIGLYLLKNGDKLALKIVPQNNEKENEIIIDVNEIQTIAFSIVGLILIILAITDIFNLCTHIYSLMNHFEMFGNKNPELILNTIGLVVKMLLQIIIGITLFFKGNYISFFWKRIEYERDITR